MLKLLVYCKWSKALGIATPSSWYVNEAISGKSFKMADEVSKKVYDKEEPIGEKPPKIARIDVNADDINKKNIASLKYFKFLNILCNDVTSKTIYIKGKYVDEYQPEEDALIKLEKSPFDDETVEKYFTQATKLELAFRNDIYCQYKAIADPELNSLKAVTIVPATERHFKKYANQEYYIVNETPKDYNEIALPYIQENQHSSQWVTNILEHKAEADRIIFEDQDPANGFILLPDLKWNEQQVTDLHLTAIVFQKELHSLRDVKREHLPLLKNILIKGKEAAKEKYNVNPDQLRIFVHYYPSYYHLHVHFMSTAHVSGACVIGRAHFLSDIIDNIENIDPNFYQKKTLSVAIGNQSPLLQRFFDQRRILPNTAE